MRIKGKLPLAEFVKVKVKVKAQKLWMRNKVIGQSGSLVNMASRHFISWFWDGDDGDEAI